MEIEEAVRLISESTNRITDTINIPLENAIGHILADDLYADRPVPSFARSAMDGYAVCASDVSEACEGNPVKLRVSKEVLAGDDPGMVFAPQTAVRIMTGAMIPAGYDAVVRQEDTDYGEKEVLIYSPVSFHAYYCPVGE